MKRFSYLLFWFPLTLIFIAGPTYLASSTGVARADEAAVQREAKSHFQTGLRLYKEGAYEAALVEFQESYRLGKRGSALRNVAQCQRDMRDFAAAHASFERLLAEHGSELKEDERKNVARAMAEVAMLTGFIDIRVSVAGAKVELNGKPLGDSPLAGQLRANVGNHRVRVTMPGYETFEGDATVVAEKSTTVDVPLRAEVTTGRVVVRARNDAKVPVLVDGNSVGTTPWEGDLPPGQHTIQLKDEHVSSQVQTVDVVLKSRHEMTLDAIPEMGILDIQVSPGGATIVVDGAVVGRGHWTGEVVPGKHRAQISFPGMRTETLELDVTRGRTLTQTVSLARPTAEPSSAAMAPQEPEWSGMYFGLGLNVDVIGKAGEHPPCPEATGATCKEMKPLGGALFARLGYSFGFVGPELVAGTRFQMYEDTREFQDLVSHQVAGSPYQPYAYDRKEVFRAYDLGVVVGLGPRLATKGPVRFTLGTALGLNWRSFTLQRRVTNGTVDFSTSYTAPTLVFDAGIMIGATPGSKVYVGFLGQADFPPDDLTSTDNEYYEDVLPEGAPPFQKAAPVYTNASGTQFFFGPIVGIQFGH